jgi:hypothetical protein
MKKIVCCFLIVAGSRIPAQAQVLEIIQAVTTKVIMAIDLGVQKLQNETIWLQDAQKQLENTLSQLKLQEIGSWVQQEKDLYSEYYNELSQVKRYITEYDKVKTLISQQAAIVSSYNQAMAQFKQDPHFTAAELQHMEGVYQGIMSEAVQWLDQATLVLQALLTSMTDQQRLQKINEAASKTTVSYNAMQQFTTQNQILSLQRSKDQEEVNQALKLYNLEQ